MLQLCESFAAYSLHTCAYPHTYTFTHTTVEMVLFSQSSMPLFLPSILLSILLFLVFMFLDVKQPYICDNHTEYNTTYTSVSKAYFVFPIFFIYSQLLLY